MNKPPQILELEKHLGFELTETHNPEDILDWKKSKTYLLNNAQEVIGLNLRDCNLVDISFLCNLTDLLSLYLRNNQISDISSLRNLTSLQSLYLGGNQISDISSLCNLTSLQNLDLRSNQISDISSLCNLTNLKNLNLWDNKIYDVSFLKGLINLQSLDLGENKISNISFLCNLTNLKNLDLWSNRISDISSLYNLTNLQSLYLRNNKISDVSFLKGLINLQSLDLWDNRISDVSSLYNLTNLQSLNLGGNQISDISLSWLRSFTNLKELYLIHNPIQNIPSEIFDKHENILPQVRHYLEGIAKDEETGKITYNREMKMILVGNGGVGKTQTANRLAQGEAFVFNPKHDSTHGIVQMPYRLGDVLFHLWDFAGQDIYHATHRLFLQTRALFVLVWDYETEQNTNETLDYWLQYIQCFGKDSQVILLQNKIDLHPDKGLHSKDLKTLQEKYPILTVIRTSAETGDGFDELAYYIEDAIENSPILAKYFQQKIVSNWVSVREEIREKREAGEKLMTKADFVALCAKYETEYAQNTILAYLHDTGEVYYRAGYFNDNIILNQDWAIQAIYQVLDRTKTHSKIIRNNKGYFDYVIIAKIWGNNTDDERKLFIDFMLSAELCFEVTANKKHDTSLQDRAFVIPQLLPERNAEIAYEIGKAQARHTEKISYPFLPTVFMDRFIVQASRLSAENYIWTGGILLDTNEGKAVVEADYKQKHISIKAESPRLLKAIKGVLQKITYEGKIKNDIDCLAETKTMWVTFEENQIFKKENPEENKKHIARALACLEKADYAGYFEEMNKVEMPSNLIPTYAELEEVFIQGLRTVDFNQRLKAFANKVNRFL